MMRKPRQLIVFGLLATVFMSAVFLTAASAEDSPTTEAQIARIRSSCVSAKNTLSQLHASDALLRVNRGQIYESMTTMLMHRFNSRVSSNNLDAKNLMDVTNSYSTALTTFRADYQLYEEQLSLALKIDCTKEPVAFYDAVASSRTKRSKVHADVVILHQFIDDYSAEFTTFKDAFIKTSKANNS